MTGKDKRSESPTPIPTFDAPTESANSVTVGVVDPTDNATSSMNNGRNTPTGDPSTTEVQDGAITGTTSSQDDGTATPPSSEASLTTDGQGDALTGATVQTDAGTATTVTSGYDAATSSVNYGADPSISHPSANSLQDATSVVTNPARDGTSTVTTLLTNKDTVTSSTEVPTEDTTSYPHNDDDISYDYHDDYDYNDDDDDDDDYDYNYDYDYDYYDYDYYGFEGETKEKEFEIEETIRAELALKDDSTIIEMGHQFENLVFECSFRGYDCRYRAISREFKQRPRNGN